MDRKSIIGIALAVGLFAWAQYQTNIEQKRQQQLAAAAQMEEQATKAAAANSAAGNPAASAAAGDTSAVNASGPNIQAANAANAGATAHSANGANRANGANASAPAVAPETLAKLVVNVPEKLAHVKTDAVDYTFTNLGGGIASLELRKHLGANPGKPSEKAQSNMELNTAASHPIGALLSRLDSTENDAYTVSVKPAQNGASGDAFDAVVFEKTVPPGILIRKTYTIPRNSPAEQYRVKLAISFTNQSPTPVDYPASYLFTGAATPMHPADYYIGFDWYNGSSNNYLASSWFAKGMFSDAKPSYTAGNGNVLWAGVRNPYFTSMILPATPAKPDPTPLQGAWARPLEVTVEGKPMHGVEGGVELAGFKLAPGETKTEAFTLYNGPAEYNELHALGQNAKAMMYLDRWTINRVVGTWLLQAMNWLHAHVVANYALAIILLTFIVRGLLFPIQARANKSMKVMQLLQPKMTELREKYKDDPTRMNQEVIRLYKEYKANPLGGCLPMLIQIPIFIGFYTMLGTAVELRNQGFLWVHDLSRPDTVAVILGYPLNILPLLMAATLLLQMSITPKAGDPAQQKMMMFMPLIFVIFTYNFASALALYYTVQNLLATAQLYYNQRQPMPTLQKVKVAKAGKR